MNGDDNQIIEARSALLDALEALSEHQDSVILVGAQAIYLHTGSVEIALAEYTKDSDLAIDTRTLGDDPLIEAAMSGAGFSINPVTKQPGAWVTAAGIPVDLMVPAGIAPGRASSRSVDIPPHYRFATRRTLGLEATLVDNTPMTITALVADDKRAAIVRVAGPAALLVAKSHKLAERVGESRRLYDKDAHDIYRLLLATDTDTLAASLRMLSGDPVSAEVTATALVYVRDLFGAPESQGSMMAGRAETGVGEPDVVRASVSALVQDLLDALEA